MKKSISILVLLALVTAGAFAIDMSVGGGALLDLSLNNGLSGSFEGFNFKQEIRNTSFGGFVFFDATYAEIDVSFAYGLLKWSGENMGGPGGNTDIDGNLMQLGFSLLGKYPIDLGMITISPILGGSYNVVLSGKLTFGGVSVDLKDMEDIDNVVQDLSQFGVLGGVGVDFPLTSSLYLRGQALFQLRFPMKFFREMAEGPINATYGMGPRVKVGVGYKF